MMRSQDLRYAARRLRASPGFTLTAVLSLALGIGANTAIFSLVNTILLRPLPFSSSAELVNIYIDTPDFPWNVFSYPDFVDLRDGHGGVFAGVAGTRLVLVPTDRDGAMENLIGEAVTGNCFPLLGLNAAVGRTLLPEDDVAPRSHPVVMLGHDYWRRAHGADPGVVGREIRLGGDLYTVVGVAPSEFKGNFRGLPADFYAPMMMINVLQPGESDDLRNRGNHSLFVRGRLAPGVPPARVQAALDGIAARLSQQAVEDWDRDGRFVTVPTDEVVLYPPFDRYVHAAAWLLFTVVGLVLLMACMNLASFLLARGIDRRKEIAVRLALGAGRGDLVAQLLTESLLLGLLGGLAGLALAVGLLRLLVTADLPLPIPVTLDLGLDARVLFFCLAVSLLAGAGLGLLPALRSTRPDLAGTLKDESAGGGQAGRSRLRNALVAAQVAASLVLLVTAGLFLRSFQHLQGVDPGFGRSPAALFNVLVPTSRFDEAAGREFVRTLVERVGALPGVESVGLTDNLHLNSLNTQNLNFNVDGVEPPPGREAHLADTAVVDARFFDATGIRIVRGRNFDATDREGGRRVAIVSEAMARRFWGSPERALGGTIRREGDDPDLEIVGVASDAKVRTLGEAPRSFVYISFDQRYAASFTVVARTGIDPRRLLPDMLAEARRLDPGLWIWDAKTMDRHLAVVRLPAQLSALLLTVAAALALLLALIGLHGVVSYAVSQRYREVGIRMSLGADRRAVVRLLMSAGLKLVAAGIVLGLLVAAALARLLGGLLYDVATLDPLTFAAVPLLLAAAALLAAWIPARRAARIDPVSALRAE